MHHWKNNNNNNILCLKAVTPLWTKFLFFRRSTKSVTHTQTQRHKETTRFANWSKTRSFANPSEPQRQVHTRSRVVYCSKNGNEMGTASINKKSTWKKSSKNLERNKSPLEKKIPNSQNKTASVNKQINKERATATTAVDHPKSWKHTHTHTHTHTELSRQTHSISHL